MIAGNRERWLLLALRRTPDQWVTWAELAGRTSVNQLSIYDLRHLEELEREGHLERSTRRNDKAIGGFEYVYRAKLP